jgi:hypothetical protein
MEDFGSLFREVIGVLEQLSAITPLSVFYAETPAWKKST